MERLSGELRQLADAERAEAEPNPDELERTRRAVLVRVGAAGAAAGVASSVAKSAAGSALGLAVKIGVPVLIAGSVAAFAVPRWSADHAPKAPPAVISARPVPVAPSAVTSAAPPPEPTTEVAAAPVPRGATSAHAEPSLAEEVRLLREAQRSLRGGQPGAALALLTEHERRFPKGQLAVERSAARIAALCALGRVAEAKQRGAAFLGRHGGSPIAEQVRASCAGDGSPAR